MDYKERSLFLEERIKRLNEIGIALSTESNTNKLFEMILEEARQITHAVGRTLYTKDEDGYLKFEIMITDSKGTYMGGTSGIDTPIPPIYDFLTRATIRRVIVTKNKRPTGILSRASLMRWAANSLTVHSTRPLSSIDRESPQSRVAETARLLAEEAESLEFSANNDDGSHTISIV